MIEACELSKIYQNGTLALDRLRLRIAQGELVFLTGPSGAGKSTLLKLIIGAERPTSGRLLVNGTDVGRSSPAVIRRLRRSLGVVFQDFRLLKGRTALDNVAVGLWTVGIWGREVRERSMEALRSVGLSDKSGVPIDSLSWGEQQRVAVARALVRKPQLLLADEPTGNLDAVTAATIMGLFVEANREGCTVLVATHSSFPLEFPSGRLLLMERGRIAKESAGGSARIPEPRIPNLPEPPATNGPLAEMESER